MVYYLFKKLTDSWKNYVFCHKTTINLKYSFGNDTIIDGDLVTLIPNSKNVFLFKSSTIFVLPTRHIANVRIV